jgi:uncharacterized lipoprotein YmbA
MILCGLCLVLLARYNAKYLEASSGEMIPQAGSESNTECHRTGSEQQEKEYHTMIDNVPDVWAIVLCVELVPALC